MKPGPSKEMGKEVYSDVSVAKENKHYTVEEVKRHNKRDDNWLMINGKVYDLSRWAKKHPGGAKILGHYAGEDATVSFVGICNIVLLMMLFLINKLMFISNRIEYTYWFKGNNLNTVCIHEKHVPLSFFPPNGVYSTWVFNTPAISWDQLSIWVIKND